ncbi:8-oxo-dGTP pyrophosphatase MutT, NUDIX family [Raineyella antarctica]|uniref:8-oxo-dGTP pyrophosphatase MutT, NUDIX family n=1 Tax=Raineyella antarctica TaxID=1577474 RepID=A0A1G6GG02_9ACTN|nr:CoA pyrophosphatase [Raineyella antarctica]SDB80753.1 8-oxo-dGTP pyrophosphatase MutT, NUDIX family [Raineyella antarctica]
MPDQTPDVEGPDFLDDAADSPEHPLPLTGYPRELGERDSELDERPAAQQLLPTHLHQLEKRLQDPHTMDRILVDRAGQGGRRAAVLALFDTRPPGGRLLFVEKAAHLRRHAGQIAFPGGTWSEGDEGPVGTAQREAGEEAAVRPDSFRVLGVLPTAHVAVSGFDVTTVIAWWHTPHPVRVNDPGEIAALHEVEVRRLVQPENRARVAYPGGRYGPAFLIDELFIWGLTAHLVDAIIDLAGWTMPWDHSRVLDVPRRFGRDRNPGH